MPANSTLEIVGASELELLELEEVFADGTVTRRPREAGSSAEHGDLGLTAATVIVTTAALHALAVWLAKRRVEDVRSSGLSIETRPDGTFVLNLTQMSRGKLSESPDPKVVEGLRTQLSSVFAAAPNLLNTAAGKTTEARP